MARIIKKSIQSIVNKLGFQISKVASTSYDAFDLQHDLITSNTPSILDIGAHEGAVARIYRKKFLNAKIHCFEPYPDSFKILSDNTLNDVNTVCHQIAISNSRGTSTLNSNADSSTNSLLNTDSAGAAFWGKGLLETKTELEVKTSTIDIFCEEQGISHIDILKIDTQGAEYAVFQGAQGMLAAQNIDIIYTELIMCPTYQGQHKLHEYLSLLDSFGYEALDFFDQIRRRRQLVQSDVIFLSSTFKNKIEKLL